MIEHRITGAGIDVAYMVEGNNAKATHGYLGLAVPMTARIDTIRWKRKALWTTYPKDHIGRPEGVATKRRLHADVVPGERIDWPSAEDSHNFYFTKGQRYDAPVDFLATKRNIERFSATAGTEGTGLAIVMNDVVPTHCQMAVDADGMVTLGGLNLVNYHRLGKTWGNYVEPCRRGGSPFRGKACLRFVMPKQK